VIYTKILRSRDKVSKHFTIFVIFDYALLKAVEKRFQTILQRDKYFHAKDFFSILKTNNLIDIVLKLILRT